MEVFRIKPNGFEEIRKKRLNRALPPLIIAVIMGMAVQFFRYDENGNSFIIILIMIPVTVIILIWSVNKGIKRARKIFESLVIEIDDKEIVRMVQDTPVIRIAFPDIKEIGKNAKDEIVIKGRNMQDIITIPPQVENRERLQTLLHEIKPLDDTVAVSFAQKYTNITSIISAGSFIAVVVSENKIVVALCGTFCLLILGYSFFSIRRDKNIDSKSKRIAYISLIVVFSIIGVMYNKLSR